MIQVTRKLMDHVCQAVVPGASPEVKPGQSALAKVITVPVFAFGAGICDSLSMLFLMSLLQRATEVFSSRSPMIWSTTDLGVVTGFVVLAMGRPLLDYLARRHTEKILGGYSAWASVKIFENSIALGKRGFDKAGLGSLSESLQNLPRSLTLAMVSLQESFTALLLATGHLLVLLYVAWPVAIGSAIAGVIIGVARKNAHVQILNLSNAIGRARTELRQGVLDSWRTISVITAHHRAADEVAKYRQSLQNLIAQEQHIDRLRGKANLVDRMLQIGLGAALVLCLPVILPGMYEGRIHELVVAFILVRKLLGEISEVRVLGKKAEDVVAKFEQINKFVDSIPPKIYADLSGPAEFQELIANEIGYDIDGVTILTNISLKLRRGEFVGIAGPSGAGKSTLLAVLARLYPLTRGSILIDGHNIDDYSASTYHSLLGYMPQECFVPSTTLREFLLTDSRNRFNAMRLSGRDDDRLLLDALREVGLERLVQNGAGDLNRRIGEGGIQLSGGERQRLVLAGILIRKPQIVLLDEPSSGADHETQALIQQLIAELRGTAAVLAVSHRLELFAGADRIYRLMPPSGKGLAELHREATSMAPKAS